MTSNSAEQTAASRPRPTFLAGAVWMAVAVSSTLMQAEVDRWTLSSPPADVWSMALGGGVVYATTFGGIYRSMDAGRTWTLMGVPPPPFSLVMDILVVDPSNSTTLYGGRGGPNTGVFKSLDAGADWTPSGSGIPPYLFPILAIDPSNPKRLLVGNASGLPRGIYLSTDAAANWALLFEGPDDFAAMLFDPASPERVYAIADTPALRNTVIFSVDGGITWRTGDGLPDTGGRTSLAIDSRSESHVYVTDYCCRTLWKSTDHGASWTRLSAPLTDINSIVLDPKTLGVLYLGGDGGPTPMLPPPPGGVLRSADGGLTWSFFNDGFPPFPGVRQLLIDPGGRFLLALNYDQKIYSYTFSQQELAIPAISRRGTLLLAALLAGSALWALKARV